MERSLFEKHLSHAIQSLGLFLLVGLASAPLAYFFILEVSTALWSNMFWLSAFGGVLCLVFFLLGLNAWYAGAETIRDEGEQWIAEQEHQRAMQMREYSLRRMQFFSKLSVTTPPLPQGIMFGRDTTKPDQHTLLRVESKPPEEFLRWLWKEGNKRGTVWGEERIAAKWGKQSDAWLGDLSRLGWIAGRDFDTRKPGTLQGTVDEVLEYFNYTTALSADGSPKSLQVVR